MSKRTKYPKTFHLPWSPGTTSDDRLLKNCDQFVGQEVVVTEKFDGENSTLGVDYTHARSLEDNYHPSRNMVKALQARIGKDIPEGWRICGENMFAKHSIFYNNLKSDFLVFNIWNDKNECLSWDETVEWCQLLDLTTVSVLYRGIWDEGKIREMAENLTTVMEDQKHEGLVVRLASKFRYADFKDSVAKYVRRAHVQTDQHWMNQEIIRNIVKGK